MTLIVLRHLIYVEMCGVRMNIPVDRILAMCRDCDYRQSIHCKICSAICTVTKVGKGHTLLLAVGLVQAKACPKLYRLPSPSRGLPGPFLRFSQILFSSLRDLSRLHPCKNECFHFPSPFEQLPALARAQPSEKPS